jgi:predicted nucleic acid-binding protein
LGSTSFNNCHKRSSWTEFLHGPATPLEVSRAEAVLQSPIILFAQKEAALAADLFNRSGRRRGSRFDCLIAATAMIAQAESATVNQSDSRVQWLAFYGNALDG